MMTSVWSERVKRKLPGYPCYIRAQNKNAKKWDRPNYFVIIKFIHYSPK